VLHSILQSVNVPATLDTFFIAGIFSSQKGTTKVSL